MMNDRAYMLMALELARRAEGYTSPNPMVGAVVVQADRVVGRGFHEAAGRPHAEVNAIDDAAAKARGATLYVTLEPCNHTGRTPPCTEKILSAGIRRVVVAMADPNPSVAGGGARYLQQHGVSVIMGVCESEARGLNEAFITYVTTGRPFVILKWAATLDGRLATRSGDSRWVTGTLARQRVHQLRHGVDAILVGVGTVKCDNPQLTTRLEQGGQGKDPLRIVLDTRISISLDAKLLHHRSSAETLIVCGPDTDPHRMAALQKCPAVRVMTCPVTKGGIDLDALMARLGGMMVTSLLIEGGAKVHGSALAAGIVDKVMLFYAPKILGGDDGVPVVRGTGPELMAQAKPIKALAVTRLGDDVLMEGYL